MQRSVGRVALFSLWLLGCLVLSGCKSSQQINAELAKNWKYSPPPANVRSRMSAVQNYDAAIKSGRIPKGYVLPGTTDGTAH